MYLPFGAGGFPPKSLHSADDQDIPSPDFRIDDQYNREVVRCAVLQHVVGVKREGCVRFNISRHCPEKARVEQEITEPAEHAHRAVVVNERTIEAFTNALDVRASLPFRVYVTSTLDVS